MTDDKKPKGNTSSLINSVSFEDILASLPGHVYWKDRNGVFLGCNFQQAKDAGLSEPAEIIGKTDNDMPWHSRASEIRRNDRLVMETGEAQTVEEFDYLSRKVPLRDKAGQIVGLLGVSIRISEYKEVIERDRQILEEIVAIMPGHVYWKDRDCILQGCNDQQAKDAGLRSRRDVVGKTAYDLLWQDQPEKAKRQQAEITNHIDKDIMNVGIPKTLEEFVVLPDGSKATFLSKKVPLHDKKGNVIGLVGISFDITDRKQAEKELLKAKEKAEAANTAKTEFLANMRHDFRTPFSGILSMAQILESSETKSEKKEYLGYISQSAKVLLDQLNEIFEFIQSENGALPILDKQFDIHQVINDISDIMTPAAKSKNLLLEVHCDKDVPQFLIGDKIRIHRVLVNLLSNAIKFTEEGIVGLSLSLVKDSHNKVILKYIVKDTGIGIPENKKDAIFERFNRLTSSYSGVYSGKGLGLRQVKRFLDEINGEVHLKSKEGEGSTFIVLAPYKLPLLGCAEDELE